MSDASDKISTLHSQVVCFYLSVYVSISTIAVELSSRRVDTGG